ncbi:type VI secretion system Vgr family protein [Paraburkholderia xenovorans]|uniref:type VI secretion system Vgr family protein n=1 Tax=Paraburkholderia xenovorans TaxID=36873 RepID=UPI0038B8E4DB
MNAQDLAASISGGLVQQDRLLKLDTPLGSSVLVPQRAMGRSRLGRHFEFTVDAVSTSGSLELKTLIAQPVTLWIQQSDKSYLPHHGHVHTARRLGSNSGLTSYQFTFASWMHFLKFRRDQRIWQDKPADEIISDVFGTHPQAQGMFQFALSKPLPARSYCRQDEDDWHFVHRLLESEGLYGFWQQSKDGKSHTLVITDRLQTLEPMSPATVKFYRAGTGSEMDALTQWSGTRTLQSTALTTRTFDYKSPSTRFNPKGTSVPTMPDQGRLPDQAEVYEYTGAYTYAKQERGDDLSRIRMEEWESRAKRFHGVGGLRGVDAGLRFTLSGHPDHDRDNATQREFAVVETAWSIQNNLPVGNGWPEFPHSLQNALSQMRESRGNETQFKVSHADGSEGFYRIDIEAQRTSVPFRSPLEHRKPETHLESAIVVGPKGEEVYTDELNRIKVQFIWDRENGGDERASCWVRAAQSDTGDGYGGVHMPRVGEEVLIDHIGGDCDRPVVISRLYNGAAKPQWHSNGLLSGYRSKEYGGNGYNQMVMDDSTGQNRVHVYSSSASSHLHLGYLVQHSSNTRGAYLGSGFDLKSEAYGAIRAGQGLFVSTHPATAIQPLSAGQASEQLVSAEALIENLSQASVANQAESLQPGQDALKAFTDSTQHSLAGSASGGRTAGGGTGNANGFDKPIMLIASPAGLGLSTQQSTQIAADQHVNVVSGQSTHIVSGKSLIASVTEKISLFVQNAGMKLFAAKGKVEIKAQSDEMTLAALKDLTITSSNGRLVLTASSEVWIGAGGSYIRINANAIENGTPGQILERGASWEKQGPTSVQQQQQEFFESQKPLQFSQQVFLDEILHKPEGAATPVNYKFIDDTGAMIGSGLIDESGKTLRAFTDAPKPIRTVLDLNQGKWTTLRYDEPFTLSSNETDKADAGVFDYPDHETSDGTVDHGDDPAEYDDTSTET